MYHCYNTKRNNASMAAILAVGRIWTASSEFVSSSIPSWQILTAHAQPFRGARDLAFCLKVPLDSLLVWASSGGSGETARMRRLAWTFAARIGDKYQIRLTRPIWCCTQRQLHQRQKKTAPLAKTTRSLFCSFFLYIPHYYFEYSMKENAQKWNLLFVWWDSLEKWSA